MGREMGSQWQCRGVLGRGRDSILAAAYQEIPEAAEEGCQVREEDGRRANHASEQRFVCLLAHQRTVGPLQLHAADE